MGFLKFVVGSLLVLVVGGMAGGWSVDAKAKTARVPGECEVLDVLDITLL